MHTTVHRFTADTAHFSSSTLLKLLDCKSKAGAAVTTEQDAKESALKLLTQDDAKGFRYLAYAKSLI